MGKARSARPVRPGPKDGAIFAFEYDRRMKIRPDSDVIVPTMSVSRIGGLILAVGLAVSAMAWAEPTLQAAAGDERLVYRWKVEGVKGLLLRLVAPGRGEGSLTTVLNPQGHLETELHMSARKRRQGDFWRYGSSVDPVARRSLRAWTAQKIGDKEKSREADLEDDDLIDLASGILLVRRDPPTLRRKMRIWSNGKLYPVVIEPQGEARGQFRGRRVRIRVYSIRGYRVPGEPEWKGGLELHLADDPSATPVEMHVLNKGVRARLRLDEEESQFGLPDLRATEGP